MWYAKPVGGYQKEGTEARTNCTNIFNILKSRGWALNPICACLGNNNHEGQYNPWRWEGDNVLTVAQYQALTEATEMSHGYGMWGFTPASKYIENAYAQSVSGYQPNFADRPGWAEDGSAQTYFMDSGGSGWNIRSEFNNMTFNEFKRSEYDLYYLTRVFLYCFENPQHPEESFQDRYNAACYWYSVFQGVAPDPVPPEPDPPEPPPPTYIDDMRRWKFYLGL